MKMKTKPEIIYCDQNSPEWYAARSGVITASGFSKVLAGGSGITRQKYMYQIAAERIRGVSNDNYSSEYMRRGHEDESTVVELYEEYTKNKTTAVGFVKFNEDVGCSPDRLVGKKGIVEIKTRSDDRQIEILLKNKVPAEHRAQIQGNLLVTGVPWLDFVSYCPGLPLFVERVERDESYISTLMEELLVFNTQINAVVKLISEKF